MPNSIDSQITVDELIKSNKLGADYFLKLTDPEEISAKGYILSRRKGYPAVGQAELYREWQNWMTAFKDSSSNLWSSIASSRLKISKAKFSDLVKQIVNSLPQNEDDHDIHDDIDSPEVTHSSEPPATTSESTETRSSISSSSTLSLKEIDLMKSVFSSNFAEYNGEPWLLPSGTNIDEAIFQYTNTLGYESTLHSFVLDGIEPVMQSLGENDRESFRNAVDQIDSLEAVPILPEWKQKTILQYSKSLQELQQPLSHGWSHFFQDVPLAGVEPIEANGFGKMLYTTILNLSSIYEQYNNKLPENQLEDWYFSKVWTILIDLLVNTSEWLEIGPCEACSVASSLRRNSGRDLGTRQAIGNKIDGLITCKKSATEIAAIEAGKKNQGPTGTKVLKDGRKLSKLLKDMIDEICRMSFKAKETKRDLQVYGLLVSGLTAEFVSMKHVGGRYYRLTRERTLSLPLIWDDRSVFSVLLVVKEMLVLRSRIESTAKLAYDCVHPDKEDVMQEMSGSVRSCKQTVAYPQTFSWPRSVSKRRKLE
ncbi:hypothetical protein BGZ76_003106 [Entomortierella beljakovae]|nr:hypothetical protein BGZ76_003106 [Entomortierella beljakovae]